MCDFAQGVPFQLRFCVKASCCYSFCSSPFTVQYKYFLEEMNLYFCCIAVMDSHTLLYFHQQNTFYSPPAMHLETNFHCEHSLHTQRHKKIKTYYANNLHLLFPYCRLDQVFCPFGLKLICTMALLIVLVSVSSVSFYH